MPEVVNHSFLPRWRDLEDGPTTAATILSQHKKSSVGVPHQPARVITALCVMEHEISICRNPEDFWPVDAGAIDISVCSVTNKARQRITSICLEIEGMQHRVLAVRRQLEHNTATRAVSIASRCPASAGVCAEQIAGFIFGKTDRRPKALFPFPEGMKHAQFTTRSEEH